MPLDYQTKGCSKYGASMGRASDLPADSQSILSVRKGRWQVTRALDAFERAYLESMLWSSTDNSRDDGGDPLDANYTVEDVADDTVIAAQEDCAKFREIVREKLPAIKIDTAQGGHDFWLTRNHHGRGFWDGDWDGPEGIEGRALTDIAQEFPECCPVVERSKVWID